MSVQKDVDDFFKLHEQEWADKISVKALNSLAFRKHNKPKCLPLTEDLLKLRKFQLEKMEELHQRLQIFPNTEIWRELATICLSRMIVFNKEDLERQQDCASMFSIPGRIGTKTKMRK